MQAAHIKFKVSPTLSSHFTFYILIFMAVKGHIFKFMSFTTNPAAHAKWLEFIVMSRHQHLWQLLNMSFNLGHLMV